MVRKVGRQRRLKRRYDTWRERKIARQGEKGGEKGRQTC